MLRALRVNGQDFLQAGKNRNVQDGLCFLLAKMEVAALDMLAPQFDDVRPALRGENQQCECKAGGRICAGERI